MKKKALVVYYSQSGQLKNIVDSVCDKMHDGFEFTYEELQADPDFPFPWKGMSFYQAFPESVQEIACQLKPFSFDPEEDFDLIILAYQPWYLSPSIPITSFLQTKAAAKVMRGKAVITIIGSRNMWVKAQQSVKKRIRMAGGKLIGNIVLADRHHNLVSVVTIVRWMLKGEKKGKGLYGKLFPEAGIALKDIENASIFGTEILHSFEKESYEQLQDKLLAKGAVQIKPVLLAIEKRGHMMFKPWSKFVLKKGSSGDPGRVRRLKMFRAYLFTVIYLVSPFGGAIFWLIYKINHRNTKKMIARYSGINK